MTLKNELLEVSLNLNVNLNSIKTLNPVFDKFMIKNKEKFDVNSTKILIDFLEKENAVSKKLTSLFYSLHNSIIDNNNEQAIKYIDLIRKSEFNANDKKYQEIFISIFDASSQYWKENNNQSKVNQRLWNLGVFVADGIGGTLGFFTGGPIGGIWGGGFCSALFSDARYWEEG